MKLSRREMLKNLFSGAALAATPAGLLLPERRIWQVGEKLERPKLGPGQVRMADGSIVQLRDFEERDAYDTVVIQGPDWDQRWATRFQQVEPPKSIREFADKYEHAMSPMAGFQATEEPGVFEDIATGQRFRAQQFIDDEYELVPIDETPRDEITLDFVEGGSMTFRGLGAKDVASWKGVEDMNIHDLVKYATRMGLELNLALVGK